MLFNVQDPANNARSSQITDIENQRLQPSPANSGCGIWGENRSFLLFTLNLLPLFRSFTPATAQKPVNPISQICGLGASVGCERVSEHSNRSD